MTKQRPTDSSARTLEPAETEPAASPADLVADCLQGESAAWNALVDRYVRLVRGIALRHGLSAEDVEDVTQDVFVALARSLHEIDDPERLPGWLATTTRRLCWRLVAQRRTELHGYHGDLTDHASDGAPPSPALTLPGMTTLLEGWHRQEMLGAALHALNARCRTLISLLFLDPDEPSYEEVSEQTGIPVGSIGPTRNRCLAKLRTLLEEMGSADVDA